MIKKIVGLFLVLILCLGVIQMGYAEMTKDDATMAITLAINENLENVDMVESCQFWLTPLDEELPGDKPVIMLDSENNGVAIFGSTYAAAWLFDNVKVFNVIVEFCSETTVTDTFTVNYK